MEIVHIAWSYNIWLSWVFRSSYLNKWKSSANNKQTSCLPHLTKSNHIHNPPEPLYLISCHPLYIPACGLLMISRRSTIPAKPLLVCPTLAAECKLAEARSSLWWLWSFDPMPTSSSWSYDPYYIHTICQDHWFVQLYCCFKRNLKWFKFSDCFDSINPLS